MRETARLFVTVAALALWQGGLTFYAVVVVPVANTILKNGEQGFVTQQVTNWLNYIGVLTIAIVIANAARLQSRRFWILCSLLAATQVGLFVVHSIMDGLLEPSAFAVTDYDTFELCHEAYLSLVTVQWCAALVVLWLLLSDVVSRR